MSGIVGIINTDGAPVDRDLLWRMTEFMSYRGPDAQEVWVDGSVGFGHTMLRTTYEQAKEHQPFTLDAKVWITADARIDGRAELICKLESKGTHRLKGATDVELILRAYHVWDTSCVDHLLGDFAFAIWDGGKRRLFCARDHFGVKPFYYARVGDALIFSNTLDCLHLHPEISAELNLVAVGDFLLFGVNQDPETTIFKDISRLPGGHCFEWRDDRVRLKRYWSLPTDGNIRYKDSIEYVQRFKELLRTAVEDRLRTNRVAVSMSGGLDSPAIAATAKGILLSAGEQFDLRAYTIVYERLIPDQERNYAESVASALDIPIKYVAADNYSLFEPGAPSFPEPFFVEPQSGLTVDFPSQIAEHSRVLLTGYDGDTVMRELPKQYLGSLVKSRQFGHLAADVSWYVRSKRTLPPVGVRTFLKRMIGRYPVPTPYPPWLNLGFEKRLDLRSRWKEINTERPQSHPTRPYASRILSSPNWCRLFERYDPGITSFKIEARHPFADIRLVDYLLAIPALPWSVDKEILRVAMRGVLPEAVRLRGKSPLAGDPTLEQMRGCSDHWLDHFQPSEELLEYVDRAAIPRVAGETNSYRLWLNLLPYSLDFWLAGLAERKRWMPMAENKELDIGAGVL